MKEIKEMKKVKKMKKYMKEMKKMKKMKNLSVKKKVKCDTYLCTYSPLALNKVFTFDI